MMQLMHLLLFLVSFYSLRLKRARTLKNDYVSYGVTNRIIFIFFLLFLSWTTHCYSSNIFLSIETCWGNGYNKTLNFY
ncbi:hypothetical protein GLYMA_11G053350v4 [Glycine max]|nr:hypothetical protein GLYMA_11G053350v4 [Glycine max]KAH1157712.1 hypothetical protein GYH30_030107 [Glycine max]